MRSANLGLLIKTVSPDGWANLWRCPSSKGGGVFWWCGDVNTTPCQAGRGARTMAVGAGALLTILESSPLSCSTSFSSSSTSLSSTAFASSIISPSPSDKSRTSVAIGAGVGIPLGITALGFLGFLFWRERSLQSERRQKMVPAPTEQPSWMGAPGQTGDISSYGELTEDGAQTELKAPPPVHEMYTNPTDGYVGRPRF